MSAPAPPVWTALVLAREVLSVVKLDLHASVLQDLEERFARALDARAAFGRRDMRAEAVKAVQRAGNEWNQHLTCCPSGVAEHAAHLVRLLPDE